MQSEPMTDEFNSSWMQYEQLRLARLRQQRQRMQSMKEVIEKYSHVIRDYELKNQELVRESEQTKREFDRLYLENKELRFRNQELAAELHRERAARDGLEAHVRQLKEDISIMAVGRGIDGGVGMGAQGNYNYQVEYETLQELYQGIKKEYYLLSKQNFQLKQIIHGQSKRFHYIPTPNPKQSHSHSLSSPSKQKLKHFKLQIEKQRELIQKFKETEQQQQELIALLKNQKSKVCICHQHGRSSKRIISGKKLEGKLEPGHVDSNISIKLT